MAHYIAVLRRSVVETHPDHLDLQNYADLILRMTEAARPNARRYIDHTLRHAYSSLDSVTKASSRQSDACDATFTALYLRVTKGVEGRHDDTPATPREDIAERLLADRWLDSALRVLTAFAWGRSSGFAHIA